MWRTRLSQTWCGSWAPPRPRANARKGARRRLRLRWCLRLHRGARAGSCSASAAGLKEGEGVAPWRSHGRHTDRRIYVLRPTTATAREREEDEDVVRELREGTGGSTVVDPAAAVAACPPAPEQNPTMASARAAAVVTGLCFFGRPRRRPGKAGGQRASWRPPTAACCAGCAGHIVDRRRYASPPPCSAPACAPGGEVEDEGREGGPASVREAPEGKSREERETGWGERRRVGDGGGVGERGIKNMCGPRLLG